jgi:predicted house-cleaning NTP pyrophosphatase (Maf/HAM1 superfamily)
MQKTANRSLDSPRDSDWAAEDVQGASLRTSEAKRRKAQVVFHLEPEDRVVLGGDTVVHQGGERRGDKSRFQKILTGVANGFFCWESWQERNH